MASGISILEENFGFIGLIVDNRTGKNHIFPLEICELLWSLRRKL
jgi:hypothetical protein